MVRQIQAKKWKCGRRVITFDSPLVMGILNVTPDSFYADSRLPSADAAIQRGITLAQEGAAILDIGGESTRPGATPLTVEAECERILPVLTTLRAELPTLLLSVDTRHTRTAEIAIEAGADIINDVSGCTPEEGMLHCVAQSGAGYILTHATGVAIADHELNDPATCTPIVQQELLDAAYRAQAEGVAPEQIQLDPGLGFAKSHAVSTQLLKDTAILAQLPYSLMIAASRKRFLGDLTGRTTPETRKGASIGAALFALSKGANVVRVHDVRDTVDALRIFSLLTPSEDSSNV